MIKFIKKDVERDLWKKYILQEREKMLAHFQDLKAQMNKLRERERDKLTKMTLESNSAMKELKRQNEKVC